MQSVTISLSSNNFPQKPRSKLPPEAISAQTLFIRIFICWASMAEEVYTKVTLWLQWSKAHSYWTFDECFSDESGFTSGYLTYRSCFSRCQDNATCLLLFVKRVLPVVWEEFVCPLCPLSVLNLIIALNRSCFQKSRGHYCSKQAGPT